MFSRTDDDLPRAVHAANPCLQREITGIFSQRSPATLQWVHDWLDSRLARWDLPGILPGWRSRRATLRLQYLSNRVRVRDTAVCLKTLLNGWATGRRFQRRARCFFGCTAGENSIEHYADCPHVSAAVYRELGLARPDTPELRLASFTLMAPPCSEATAPELRRRALATCGVYLTHCWARHAASSGALACRSALRLKLRELAGGS